MRNLSKNYEIYFEDFNVHLSTLVKSFFAIVLEIASETLAELDKESWEGTEVEVVLECLKWF